MRYYQNQVPPLTIATLRNVPYSKATEIAPRQRPVIRAKSAITFTATQEPTSHKEVSITANRSKAVIKNIPAAITQRNHCLLDRRLLPKATDFFREDTEAVITHNLHGFEKVAP